jgi:GGDEF domain-containing protein
MESSQTHALIQLTNQRYRSFSQAVDSVLGVLDDQIPGTVMLGQLDAADGLCQVIDFRGEAIELQRDMTLPLAAIPAAENGTNGNGDAETHIDGQLDRKFLNSLSVEGCLTMPLEMSDGSIIATLCALDTDTDSFRSDHLVMLGVGARLLSYEWENVNSRAELRRLKERVRDAESDADTGLPNREKFLDLLEREWRLTERGSLESMLVACHVRLDAPQDVVGEATAILALKDAAEALGACARNTDHVGRTDTMDLASVLVGCHGAEGAEAFINRFLAGVERVTQGRTVAISASCSIQALAGTESAEEALQLAESQARNGSATSPQPKPAPETKDA